jgi:dTDP-4-amino-4,6-dideoxygalactose transaminase
MSVMRSGKINYWTGQECRNFEKEFASFVGAEYAVALANGTVALEAALYGLGVGQGDDVLVTSRTFIASASCIAIRGARPIVADVDHVSQNVTAETLEDAITPNTKAIITVHLAGWPCEMDPILEIARRRGLKVIEDCAQAHGAVYRGKHVGTMGDVAAFSFCQDKIMTTGGEGGMIVTNDRELFEKVWSYKDHGKSLEAINQAERSAGFRWVHESFGTNWRMTELQAAVGRVQLRKVPTWVERRRRNAHILSDRFSCLPTLRVTEVPGHMTHSYYKYYTFVRPGALRSGWDRDRVMKEIVAEGVPCSGGSCSEIYLEKAFKFNGLQPAVRFPVAMELGNTSLMFPVHPTLSKHDMMDLGEIVAKVLEKATR